MATKRKSGDEELTRQIAMRLSEEDYARVERLAVHMSMSALARAAFLVGLDAIEAQPGVLLGEKPKKR